MTIALSLICASGGAYISARRRSRGAGLCDTLVTPTNLMAIEIRVESWLPIGLRPRVGLCASDETREAATLGVVKVNVLNALVKEKAFDM